MIPARFWRLVFWNWAHVKTERLWHWVYYKRLIPAGYGGSKWRELKDYGVVELWDDRFVRVKERRLNDRRDHDQG